MRKLIVTALAFCCLFAMAKRSGTEILGTGLVYTGPGTVTTDSVEVLKDYPYGSIAEPEAGTVVVKIENAGNKSCKIQPASKSGSQDSIALIIEGGPKMIHVDFSQPKGKGKLPYLYVNGNAGKVLCKGLAGDVGLAVVDNGGANKGVRLQNISKGDAGFHSIIIAGKLKRAQSNHGGFGGPDDDHPGIIMIGAGSPKGQIKASPKSGVAHVLICRAVDTNAYAAAANPYVAAYAECIASNEIVAAVEVGGLKKINTKRIGPAVIAVVVDKKYKPNQIGKRLKTTEPLVGKENLVE